MPTIGFFIQEHVHARMMIVPDRWVWLTNVERNGTCFMPPRGRLVPQGRHKYKTYSVCQPVSGYPSTISVRMRNDPALGSAMR